MEIALLSSAFAASVASGLVPFVNAEVVVAAAAVAVPGSQVWLVVTVCSLGQMIAKAALYALARWLPQKLPARATRHLERASEKTRRLEQAGWTLILISAFVGLPPFYVISLAAGIVRTNFAAFLTLGFAGRWARFAILAYGAAAAGGAIQGGP
ncbi:MAG: VTT domain-containing protein [Gammaproteobacteria bacterium]|nr:VTT domain-containing protein [Gammaproteobacteria bacterium]